MLPTREPLSEISEVSDLSNVLSKETELKWQPNTKCLLQSWRKLCTTQSLTAPEPSPGPTPVETSLWVSWLGQLQRRRGEMTKQTSETIWPFQKFVRFLIDILRNFFSQQNKLEIQKIFNTYNYNRNVCIFSVYIYKSLIKNHKWHIQGQQQKCS